VQAPVPQTSQPQLAGPASVGAAPSAVVPAPAPSGPQVRVAGPPPPLPERARMSSRVDPTELGQAAPSAVPAPTAASPAQPEASASKASRDADSAPESSPPSSNDSPEAAPEIEAKERELPAPRRRAARMFSLTLLDGTKISLPTPPKKHPSNPEGGEASTPSATVNDQLTARDLVSALRAVSHGVDASEILGTEPRWEALFSALLSLLLRKGLIADWEFVEEFRKV